MERACVLTLRVWNSQWYLLCPSICIWMPSYRCPTMSAWPLLPPAPSISLPSTSAQLSIHLHRLTELSPLCLCTGKAAQPLNLLAAGPCRPQCGGWAP